MWFDFVLSAGAEDTGGPWPAGAAGPVLQPPAAVHPGLPAARCREGRAAQAIPASDTAHGSPAARGGPGESDSGNAPERAAADKGNSKKGQVERWKESVSERFGHLATPFQPELFCDAVPWSCLEVMYCLCVCVCGATVWRWSDSLQSGLCRYLWLSASLLQESLEAVAKENKELQAQISQLAAEMDGRILHQLEGEWLHQGEGRAGFSAALPPCSLSFFYRRWWRNDWRKPKTFSCDPREVW